MAGRSAYGFGVSLPLLVLCVLDGMVLGLGSFTFYYAEGGSYLSNDPKACINCHVMREHYDGWQNAGHHGVAVCNDCHTPHDFFGKYLTKLENGFWHSKGFTLQDFHEPIRIKPRNSTVLRANCIDCHKELVANILGHGEPAAGVEGGTADCVRCHAEVGHGPTK